MYVVWELNTLEGTSCVCNVLLSEQIQIKNSGGLTRSQVCHQIQIFRLANPSFLFMETVDNLGLPWSTQKINQQRLSDEQVPSFWGVFSLKSVCDIMKQYGGKRWSIQGRRHKPGIAKLCQPSNHSVLHKVWWSGSTSVDGTPKRVSIAVCTHFVGTFLSHLFLVLLGYHTLSLRTLLRSSVLAEPDLWTLRICWTCFQIVCLQ